MAISFQPLGPDTRSQFNKLPEEVAKQNDTINNTLGTRVAKRRNVDTDEEVGSTSWDMRAVPTESLMDVIAEGLFGKGEEPTPFIDRTVDGITIPSTTVTNRGEV